MTKPYTFVEALADMDRIMREHPWWKRRIDGTPLANDLPVRAATLMMEHIPRPTDSMLMPIADIIDLDAVVHALGIEDSHTTPAEAIAELHTEIERLRTSLAQANAAADAEMERVKACEHIAEGIEGWEVLRNICPSTAAVAGLRDAYQARRLTLCEDCPPMGYPTDKTRCTECPRREDNPCLTSLASNEPYHPAPANLRRCTVCGFVVDVGYAAEKPL